MAVAIQFLKDGEALGEAAADASAMFGAVAAPAAGQSASAAVVFPGFMS
jgi:hypothetical protein